MSAATGVRASIYLTLRNKHGAAVGQAIIDIEGFGLSARRWCLNGAGYAVRRVSGGGGRLERLHRVVMGLVPGDGLEVDHINGDKLDNRRANLRVATHAQNGQNILQPQAGNTSLHRGVHKCGGVWVARATVAGRTRYIGRFAAETEAADAAREFRAQNLAFANEDRHVA